MEPDVPTPIPTPPTPALSPQAALHHTLSEALRHVWVPPESELAQSASLQILAQIRL